MEEIWKDIIGYESHYQVSNFGRIRSKERVVIYSNGRKSIHKARIKKASKSEYRIAVLSKNNKIKGFKISRLVAIHFIPKQDDKAIVNHIDGNKHNDHVSNLEWCTYSENSIHAFDNNLSLRKNKVAGVFYEKRRRKWASYLYRNSKNIFIGRYETQLEAIAARENYINGKSICKTNIR